MTPEIDWNAVSSVIGIVVGNLIGLGIIIKYVGSSVVKTNETLPVIAESIKTMTESIRELKQQNEELFASRNKQEKQLERIETTHKINGCELPQSQRFHLHRRDTDIIEP